MALCLVPGIAPGNRRPWQEFPRSNHFDVFRKPTELPIPWVFYFPKDPNPNPSVRIRSTRTQEERIMNRQVRVKDQFPRREEPAASTYSSRLGIGYARPLDSVVPYPRSGENALEQLKNRLLREALAETNESGLLAPLRRAANEAASLAWLEPHPLLVFPELFLEKRRIAQSRIQHQQRVRSRTARLMEAFA